MNAAVIGTVWRLVVVAGLLASCGGPAERAEPVPGDTKVPLNLRANVAKKVLFADAALAPDCKERKIVDTKFQSGQAGDQPAIERWTVDRCGRQINYNLVYKPAPFGGMDFRAYPTP